MLKKGNDSKAPTVTSRTTTIEYEEKALMSLVAPFSDSLGDMVAETYFTNFKELAEKK
jgi:hypothetical protein